MKTSFSNIQAELLSESELLISFSEKEIARRIDINSFGSNPELTIRLKVQANQGTKVTCCLSYQVSEDDLQLEMINLQEEQQYISSLFIPDSIASEVDIYTTPDYHSCIRITAVFDENLLASETKTATIVSLLTQYMILICIHRTL